MVMRLRVEIHPEILLGSGFVLYNPPTAALCSGGGLDEYQHAPLDHGHVADLDETERLRSSRGL